MSNLSEEEIASIKRTANECLTLEEAINRLESNPDFMLLYDTYTKKEPIRLVGLMSDPALCLTKEHEVHRKEILETLMGISRFSTYLRNVHNMAKRARKELEDLNKALEEDKGDLVN